MKTQVQKQDSNFKKITILLILLSTTLIVAKPGIKKIKSLDYSSSPNNFKPFAKLTKNNQIIGIGESAHASAGYMKARGRLIKYFVKNHGYRLILLESGFISTEKANEYLKLCRKSNENPEDLREGWKSLYEGYRAKETIEMLQWICDFNKISKDEIQFHGMDQWEDPWTQRDQIKKAVDELNNPRLNKLYELAVKNCYAWTVNSWKEAEEKGLWDYLLKTWRLDPEENRVCLGTMFNMERLLSRIDEPSDNVSWAYMTSKVFYVYQTYRDIFVTNISRALNMRDDLQAYLVKTWMDKYPNQKALLLEHNVHISKAQSIVTPQSLGSRFKWQHAASAGENLIGVYGNGYKAIGVTGHKVSRTRDGQYPILTRQDSLDYQLSKLGNLLYVDPKARWIKKAGKWWLHNESEPMYLNPGEQYDALLFVKESPSAIILD